MHGPSCDGTGQLDRSKRPLGERLRRLREHHHDSLRQVEEATGVSNTGLSQIETGKIHEPSFHRIMALCQFYQIKPEELL